MRVRAVTKGFNSGKRRKPGEVFEHRGKDVPANCVRVPDAEPVREPEPQPDAPQFVKKGGDFVPADQRTSADAFTSDYLSKFEQAEPAKTEDAADDGSDLT